MSERDAEFLALLRSTFKVEAEEHLQAISAGLLELERVKGADAQRVIERVFRAAHTLKGAARAVDFTEIEMICQLLEDVFASWKKGDSVPSPDALDTMHRSLESISNTLSAPAGQGPVGIQRDAPRVREAPLPEVEPFAPLPVTEPIVEVAPALNEPVTMPASSLEKPASPVEVTVRVAAAKLEAQLLQAEELLAAKQTAGQRAADLRELAGRFEAWRNAWASIEPDLRALHQPRAASAPLARLLDFFDWTLETVKSIENSATVLARTADQDRHAIGKLVDDLLDDSKKLLLLPFSTIAGTFAKMVRDLSRDQGKEADLRIQGDDVKVDKRILEEIKDPIIHLLRNSIDHGIESPEERVRKGKPARGLITIAVSQLSSSEVELFVSDDGAGIDVGKVEQAAVRQGVIAAEDAARLSPSDAQRLIFQSDVSTSPIITQVSGRGLGLAIVQEKTDKLGGEVTVDSRPGMGTTFRIVIPATRATFRGVLVQAAGHLLVIPTTQVERVGRTRPEDVQTVQGRATISFEGRAVPLVRLADALELSATAREEDPASGPVPLMVVGNGEQRVAYMVDAVLDEQEVLVKPLRKPLARVRNVAAATVLGSGEVAPILNVADLLKSARRERGAQRVPAAAKPAVTTRSILVAEDSITSRMLLKSILESAGYQVKTAVDGLEAFTLLRAERFDLVVSDVEMPRLNGFDLTSRIRADRKLADLPVVLVTALETREDRERGIDAGANAYIVKASFDQSNLLEAVRRLI